MTKSILMIDDDAVFLKAVAGNFDPLEYQVVKAAYPAEGIAILEANPDIRVIVLDLLFDNDQGTAVLKHIANRSADYRVIVLTAHDEVLAAEQAGESHVFCYLPKAEKSTVQAIRFSVNQAFKDLEHSQLKEKIDFLLRVQDKINQNAPAAETLDLICQSVRKIVGAYTCHIRVYDFKRGDFHLRGFAGPDEELRARFAQPKPKGKLFSGEVVTTGKARIHPDLQELQEFREFKAAALTRDGVTPAERRYFESVASAYIAPIRTGLYGDLVDAVLNVSSERKEFFSTATAALVDEFLSQAALAITKGWLQMKRREAHGDYGDISKMLSAMTYDTGGTTRLNSIYDVVTQGVERIVRPEVVSVFRHNVTTNLLENVAEVRAGRTTTASSEQYRPEQSLTGHVFSDDDIIHLPLPDDPNPVSPTRDTRFDSVNEAAHLKKIPSGELKHYLGVPIRIGGTVWGVLRAMNKKSQYYEEALATGDKSRALLERGFSQDCRNVLEITASHLAAAIRSAELIDQKERQVEQVRSLAEVGRLINSQIEIGELLRLTITEMAEVMQAEICMLFLKDEGAERVLLEQAFGIPESLIPGASYEIGEGVTGGVAKTRSPCLISVAGANDGKYDQMLQEYLTATHGEPTVISSLMAVPILFQGRLLGVMKVINKIGDHLTYDERDLELFKAFADYVGVAVANAQIYKHANDRLAVAERNATLSLLVSAVAHEINNTSGVIPANVDGIRELLKTPDPDVRHKLDVIADAADQAIEFANELVGFSATRTGKKQEVDINEVIRHAKEELEYHNQWHPASTSFDLALSDEPLVCNIFRTPFAQVVRNIVINAFQALGKKPGGRVLISTTAGAGEGAGSSAVVHFHDNGPGIKPEYRSRIFDPDFTTKPKGNGIGLWLVRAQLAGVGGTIEVEDREGPGASFVVKIPLARPGLVEVE